MDNNGFSKKIMIFGLVMMIIIVIFGFGNVFNVYLQMGYGSIIWYVLVGILFFFLCGLMMVEYGFVFKEVKGGIYFWLVGLIGEWWVFVGIFVWLVFWIVWMVLMFLWIWIIFLVLIFGKDIIQFWWVMGFLLMEMIGILGIILILVIIFLLLWGMNVIVWIGLFGGIFIIVVNIIFIVVFFIVLFVNYFQLVELIYGFKIFIILFNLQF